MNFLKYLPFESKRSSLCSQSWKMGHYKVIFRQRALYVGILTMLAVHFLGHKMNICGEEL